MDAPQGSLVCIHVLLLLFSAASLAWHGIQTPSRNKLDTVYRRTVKVSPNSFPSSRPGPVHYSSPTRCARLTQPERLRSGLESGVVCTRGTTDSLVASGRRCMISPPLAEFSAQQHLNACVGTSSRTPTLAIHLGRLWPIDRSTPQGPGILTSICNAGPSLGALVSDRRSPVTRIDVHPIVV